MAHSSDLRDGVSTGSSAGVRVLVLILGLTWVATPSVGHAASIHLTASAPWRFFADPLADATGSALLPAVFDALTVVETDGSVQPALAESWHNDGDRVWTFKLRPNVVFSDGTPVDANAVVECLSMQSGEDGKVYAPYLYTSEIAGVRALSDTEIEITTHRKDALLDRKLSSVSIFSVAALNRIGRPDFARAPVGSGPFTPESWSRDGTRVVLQRVPSSWRVSSHVERVEIAVITDATARLQNILSDGTDISMNIDPDVISTVEDAGYRVSVRPGPVIIGLLLRTTGDAAAPLLDRRVRRALNMAVNRDSISQNILRGTMPPATQLATPEALGYDPAIEPYAFDPDRARNMLADAGYPQGFDLTATVMTGQFPADTLIYQQVAQDLRAIGVNITIGSLPVIEFIRRRSVNAWEGIDVISSLSSHYRQGDISGAAELLSCTDVRSTFCDPETDDLLKRSHQEMNPAAREDLLKTVNARIHDLAPIMVIAQYASIEALSPRIAAFPEYPLGKMRFERIELTQDR